MEEFLEELSLNAWPAIRQIHYDNWVLRLSAGHTRRANSVNILGPSSIPVEEKVDHCEHVYAREGLPAIFKFAGTPATAELDRLLDTRGYQSDGKTLVLTRNLDGLDPIPRTGFRSEPELSETWCDLAIEMTGVTGDRAPYLRSILANIAPMRCFGSIWDGAQPAAIGLAVVERGWVGLFDIVTAPKFRRQGHGTALVRNLLGWSKDAGAGNAYLQVFHENNAAIRLYDHLGFHYSYQYWYRIKRLS